MPEENGNTEKYLKTGALLYKKLSAVNTELIAFILMLLLCCQPLYSIAYRSLNVTDLVALYLAKATVIRFIGFLGLLNAGVDFYRRCYLFGRKAALKAFIGNIWTGLFLVVFVLAFVSCFTSSNVYVSFNGDAYRFEGLVSYVAYAGIFASASLLRGEKAKIWVLRAFLYVSAVVALVTLVKEATGSAILIYANGMVAPYSGTFINPNHYGYYLCVAVITSLGLYMSRPEWYNKLAYGVLFALNLFVLLLNQSFGPYLAVMIGIVLVFVFYVVRNGFKSCWPIAIPVAVFILLSVFVSEGIMLREFAKSFGEMINITKGIGKGIETGDMDSALDGVNGGSNRFRIWVATVKVIGDYPVLGCGTDTVHRLMPAYGLTSVEMPHNEYLQITANCGIPAGVLYVTALVWFFVRNARNLKRISSSTVIAGAVTATYAVSAFFGVGMTVTTCYLFLFLGLTNSWHSEKRVEELIKTHTVKPVTEKNE